MWNFFKTKTTESIQKHIPTKLIDYRCFKRVEAILPEDIKCPIISRIIPPKETDTVYKIQLQPVSGTWSKQASVILIVVVIIYTAIVSQSKPTVCNVLEGNDILMEPCWGGQLKLQAVTWFKGSNNRIMLNPSNKQYIGGATDVPSLTIKKTTLEDAGEYFCIQLNDNGETQMSSFQLKIIPQGLYLQLPVVKT
ncbi:unnamed protein product [Mytilus coruscus]|uniref:Ig-like domain-containing protein n=1 Tax=Mytilus coruscus TaxID=42192 RepID=A0A6J8F233_MYTCO|nr:unnamed protein product [Mytilus coruscus]